MLQARNDEFAADFEAAMRRVYTLGEAAREAGVHRITFWRWVKSGKVPAYRIGREVLIENTTVEALRRAR